MRRGLVAWLLAAAGLAQAQSGLLGFTPQERAQILAHGPWATAPAPDASNRVQARPDSTLSAPNRTHHRPNNAANVQQTAPAKNPQRR